MKTYAWNYGRGAGKQAFLNDSIASWCAKSKEGSRMILASIHGNFIIEYKGIWKPDSCAIHDKIYGEES